MFCKCLRSVSIWPSANLPGDPTRGISSGYFASTFLEEVVASGLGPHEPVYTVEKVIRRKGEAVICPRDGRLGAAYVDVVTGPGAGKSEFMLSYSWGYGVGTIADTLTDFFGRDVHRYVWICCLCINQHRVKEAQAAGEVVPFKEFEEAFGKRVAGVSHILAMMSPWQEPLYLKRVWCVFEFSRAMAEKKELTVLMPPEEREAFRSHLFGSGLRELFAGLAALRIQEAKASVPVDKENILRTIDPDSKDFNTSSKVAALNQRVKEKLQAWFVDTAATWLEKKIASDHRIEAAVYSSVAEMLIESVADFQRATRILKAGLEQHGVDGPAAASFYRLHGRIAIRKGTYDTGTEYYVRARDILERCNETESIQYAQLLVDSFVATGDEVLLLRAKEIFENLEETNREDYARLLKHLGTLYSTNGHDPKEVMDFYQRSRACYKHLKLEQSPGYADLLVNMGRLEVTLDQNHEALQVFREAQNVYEAIGVTASPGYANLLLNIGHLQAQKLDDLDSAVAAFREARDIYMEVKASGIAVAQVNFNLGRALQEKGLRGEATKAYERAMKEYEACGETDQADYEEAMQFCSDGGFPQMKCTIGTIRTVPRSARPVSHIRAPDGLTIG